MGIRNELAAYCLDGAVVTLGTVIENALLERENHGSEKEPKWEAKYTLTRLLADGFTLPRPETGNGGGSLDVLRGAAGEYYDEVS